MAAETSVWIKFFENAGLPPKIAQKYSMLFLEHRIQRSMLADLTKAILNEIGITAVGDVLAILKQAKAVANKDEIEAKESPTRASVVVKPKPSPTARATVVPATSRVAAPAKVTVATKKDIPAKRIRRQSAPDHDVQYRVNLPQGTTERSRQLLKKAASVKQRASAKKSVFDRLGAVARNDHDETDTDDDEEDDSDVPASAVPFRLRKSVSFASGTKESSPEVTSTTDEFHGKLESDKLARKVSALQRLGNKSTKETVTVVGGQRRLLVAKRTTTMTKSIFERLG